MQVIVCAYLLFSFILDAKMCILYDYMIEMAFEALFT